MGHHPVVSSASPYGGGSVEREVALGAITVRGVQTDSQTRCEHYRSALDIVALKFACCGRWFPCHLCHQELADHASRTWAVADRREEAVVCGACAHLLRIAEYLVTDECPNCEAAFNPGCRLHHQLYFD